MEIMVVVMMMVKMSDVNDNNAKIMVANVEGGGGGE